MAASCALHEYYYKIKDNIITLLLFHWIWVNEPNETTQTKLNALKKINKHLKGFYVLCMHT